MVIANMEVEKMGCYHMKLQCTKYPILALFWPRLHLRAIGAYQDVGSLGLSEAPRACRSLVSCVSRVVDGSLVLVVYMLRTI